MPEDPQALIRKRADFHALFEPHLDALHRTALHMTRHPHRAEDAVQEACLRAWRWLDGFDRARNAKAWLLAILRNVVFDEIRRRRRERTVAGVDVEECASEDGALRPPDGLTREDVVEAVGRLPPEFRMTVLLVVVEDLSYREASEALGIPIGTVMSRLHRGRRLLRDALRAHAPEGARAACASCA